MTLKLIAIKDIKAEAFQAPNFVNSEPEAIRSVQSYMMTEQSNFTRFPEDYEIYNLGEFDTITGQLTPLPSPKFIISLTSIYKGILMARESMKRLGIESSLQSKTASESEPLSDSTDGSEAKKVNKKNK